MHLVRTRQGEPDLIFEVQGLQEAPLAYQGEF